MEIGSDNYCDVEINQLCEEVEKEYYEDLEIFNLCQSLSQQNYETSQQVGEGMKPATADLVSEVSAKKSRPSTSRDSGSASTTSASCIDMLKLYKTDVSPPARAAMMACELFSVPVEYIDVNLGAGEHFKPEFLKKNPLHAVPVLEDGNLIIHDSHAILMYLADVYGKQESFYPKDPKQRALVNQMLFFNSTILFISLRNISLPLIIGETKEISQNKLDTVEEGYGFLEEFLSRNKYMAGNNITIADIAAYATVSSLHHVMLNINAKKFPKSIAWLKELEVLPYVQNKNAKGVEEYKQFIDFFTST